MLLIAQPKSASTSLAFTLGKILSLNVTRLDRLGKKVPEYNLLPHTDLVQLPESLISRWLIEDTVYQQHVAPIKTNIGLLLTNQCKCVIVTRDVAESFKAYFRQPDIKAFFDRLIRTHGNSVLSDAREQLRQFHDTYRELAKSHPDHFLLVDFHVLVNQTTETINNILEFYGLSQRVPQGFQLLKMRYTENGKMPYQYEYLG